MNLNLTNLNMSSAAKGPKPADPVAAGAAATSGSADAATVQDAAAAAAQPGEAAQAAAQPALAFAQWLGLEQPAAQVAPEGADTAADELPADEQQPADTALLGGAMSMPLMPAAQAALAAVVAALPGVPAPKESAPGADTDISPAPDGAGARVDARTAGAPAAAASLADMAMPAVATATPAAQQKNAAAPALAADALTGAEAGQDQGAAPAGDRGLAQAFGVAAPASGAAQRGADTVTLSGPPTAWRQTLHEALGERLQLQLGKNAEQAVIRLEPPMLGRVEIAIRHSAGSLEVHISATHGEVLRQLQTVSENLRNDLAQRQFTDVAVNVAQAARGANAAPLFAGDGSSRGRQQDGQQQEQAPGNALAEANDGASAFSLNARA